MPTAKPKLRELESEVLEGGRVRLLHVLVPQLAKLHAGDHAEPVWALRSYNPETRKFDRYRLYQRVETLGPVWTHTNPEGPLPGTAGRGVAAVATRGAVRVYWTGPRPRTRHARD